MVKKLIILIICVVMVSLTYGQIEVKKTPAKIKKVQMIYGEFDPPKEYVPLSFIAISESDSTLLVGNTNYKISEIIANDSIITYLAKDTPKKEFVYNPVNNTLTQKNITRKDELEVWFIYTLIIEEENEFEFGG
jgi:hypothetical protein